MKSPATPRPAAAFRSRSWLALLLVFSYGLRVWLACLGGQGYWADEDRYTDGKMAARLLLHGQWSAAGRELFGHPDHTGFRWFSVPPGLVETLWGPHPALVASYFGLFSVLAIYLIWAIARRSGAGEAEALWAAYLAACANTLFYYSRHFFPYDIALCAMLGALWLGLGRWSWRNSLLVGVAAALGFLVYNGYWLLGGCVLALHSLLGAGGRRRIFARAAWSGAGLVLSLAAVAGLGRLLGYDLVGEDYQWGVIARGDFPFGRRVIAGYLWYAEGGMLLLWLAALGYALVGAWRDRRLGRLGWFASGLAITTAGLVLLSDVVPLFAVQGRRVRSLVPFLCLGAAVGIGRFLQERRRARRAWACAIALLVLVLAAHNFSRPLRQVFPDEFQRLSAQAIVRQPGFYAYRLAFAQNLWGQPLAPLLPAGPAILRRDQPLQFRPYQYEGYDTAQRADLNRHDIAMRLFQIPAQLDATIARWPGYPGPLRWRVLFPTDRESLAEPLVTSGGPGRGDFLFVRYLDRRHVAFGLDHWGSGAAFSPAVELDYAKPHELVLSLGSLFPPEGGALYGQAPESAAWRSQVLVVLDGVTVFHWKQKPWPSRPAETMLGVNLIGGTAAQLSFSGQVLKLDSPSLDVVRQAMMGPDVGSLMQTAPIPDRKAAEGSRGARARVAQRDISGRPERLAGVSFRLSEADDARAQPLLAFFHKDGDWGLLAIRRAGGGVKVGWFDAAGWWWSQALPEPAGGLHTAEVQWVAGGGSVVAGAERAALAAAMIAVDNVVYPHPRPQFFAWAITEVTGGRSPGPTGADLAASFSGTIDSPPALPALALGRAGPPSARHFRLAVRFATNRPGRNEPLLTAGRTGAADGLYVQYERPGWVRIGFDHWGEGGPLSKEARVVDGAYQFLDVDFGSGSWAHPDDGRIRVSLGGRTLLRESSSFFPAASDAITVGRNLVGLSTSDQDFTGAIFEVEAADPGR